MSSSKDNYDSLYIVISCVFLGLLITGIIVIVQTNKTYDKSIEVYNNTYTLAQLAQKEKAVYPITPPNYLSIKEGYAQALLYFTLALGALLLALLLPRLQNISISPTGGITLSLKEQIQKIDQTVGSLVEQTNQIQAVSVGSGGIKSQMVVQEDVQGDIFNQNRKVENKDNDDPQKGKWGGSAENNERIIRAIIKESERPGYYEVTISVIGINPKKPLSGLVKFHLHPTFHNPDPVIAVKDGKAVLVLKKVYGAFTVGAEADEGKTQVELDLAELPTAPEEFKDR